jgi:alpha-N-arabinofuranosidase
MISKYGHGTTMKAVLNAPAYKSEFGELAVVEPAVVYNEEADEVRVFVLNCCEEEETEFELKLQGYGDKKVRKHLVLAGDDLNAMNTLDNPGNVAMKEMDITGLTGTTVILPKLSWNVIILG